MKSYDVIVAGAGPVGLFLACELALAKCSVLILEKTKDANSPLKQLPFGIRGLSAPTIEALDRRGLLDQLEIHKRLKNPHQNSGKGTNRQAGHFAGIPFHDGDLDFSKLSGQLSKSLPLSLISEIEELESVLSRRAESLGVEIKRASPVTACEQNGKGVSVKSGDQVFYGQWLVGCDGGRSSVRKLCGFDFVGTEPEFTGYSVRADLVDPEKLKPGRNLTARGMYLQSQPGFFAIQDFDHGAFHAVNEPITVEHVQDVLRKISETDVSISTLHFASAWTDRARQSSEYQKGRILLAGDAAHIHSPLGGQGLNLGLGDAMNLGWKLARVIKGDSNLNLLSTYFSERHPIGDQVLNWSRAQVSIMRPDQASRAMNAVVRDLMATKDGATYFASKVWGVSLQYDFGGTHDLVGKSLPNYELASGKNLNDFFRESGGVLFDFKSNPLLKNWAREFDGRFQYIESEVLNPISETAILVRPDGMVAWASNERLDEKTFRSAIEKWFA